MTHDSPALSGVFQPATTVARLAARLMPWRYDHRLVAGAIPEPGSALAVHVTRLTSDAERSELAAALQYATRDADGEPALYSSRIPLDHGTVASAVTTIDEVRKRLEAPHPVRAHGVARLRMLLSDGTGPFYQPGDLAAAMRDVLADL